MAKWKRLICCIYKIENIINKKVYIGQTIHYNQRVSQHKYNLESKISNSTKLLRAWNKYGKNNFKFEVLEECLQEDLNKREVFWIEYFNSIKNGYNLEAGGSNKTFISDETRRLMSINNRRPWKDKKGKDNKSSKEIHQYSLNGKYIQSFENARMVDIVKDNIMARTIQLAARGGVKSSHGYMWRYEKLESLPPYNRYE